ncbi:hypothetical protein EHYA_05603 [Embleya hyalina]|uniref:Uncharacterized protein n=1 Tax=Embleya hyalina TaxID=516124 RepID=A0A401YTM7_9ACTN|nr:hypothetical protein EHYA_05603 [Embleya hyalina]
MVAVGESGTTCPRGAVTAPQVVRFALEALPQ